jgi:hypothetical protein
MSNNQNQNSGNAAKNDLWTIRNFCVCKNGKGVMLDLSNKDEVTGQWRHVKAYVPFAANFAGADKKPQTLATTQKKKDGGKMAVIYVSQEYVPQIVDKPTTTTTSDDENPFE